MLKGAIFVGFCLVIVGCASNNKNFYSNEYDRNEISKIIYECRQRAASATNNNRFAGGNTSASWVLLGVLNSEQEKSQLFEECVKAYGLYTKEMMLGNKYRSGDGVEKDFKKAMKYYKIASEQGYGVASYNIGTLYENGLGVPKNKQKAEEWFAKAAEQGYVENKYNNYSRLIIGRWNDKKYNGTVSYLPNHTFNGVMQLNEKDTKYSVVIGGEWNLNKNMLELKITTSNFPKIIPSGIQYAEEIIELTENKMILKDYTTGEISVSLRD